MKFLVLAASVVMLVFLATNAAWSVTVAPLTEAFGYTASQLQFVYTTSVFVFCFAIIPGGRWYDRYGPRPLALLSALMMAAGWMVTAALGDRWLFLWLGWGVLVSGGSAIGYVCPIATAIKWFPRRAGLIAGLAAAGFGAGPIVLSQTVEWLLARGWPMLRIFGLLGLVWPPIVLATGLLLTLPAGSRLAAPVASFTWRSLLRDNRFWALFFGMFFGTLPYLVVMGSVKPMGVAFGIGPAMAALAISAIAVGNSAGRILWGHAVDRLGPRRSMLAAQILMAAFMLMLLAPGRGQAGVFLAAIGGIGFCYGSNFAILPSTVARLYGVGLIGSVYPFIMAAQGLASLTATDNGVLLDRTGSYLPGLILAGGLGAAGIGVSVLLTRAAFPAPYSAGTCRSGIR